MNGTNATTRSRFLAGAGHILAFALIVLPALGIVLAAATPGPEGILGRARTFGFLVDSSLFPLTGVFLGMAVASIFGQRRTQWAYTVLAALAGLFFVGLLPFYALDVIELRRAIASEFRPLYHWNLLRNTLALTTYGSLMLLLAIGSVRALRRDRSVIPDGNSALVGSHAATARRQAGPVAR